MAIALADEEDISLVLANDPDADRFCAAERIDGKWHIFTGNEMGILLAHHVLEKYKSRQTFNIGSSCETEANCDREISNAILRCVLENVACDGREGRLPS